MTDYLVPHTIREMALTDALACARVRIAEETAAVNLCRSAGWASDLRTADAELTHWLAEEQRVINRLRVHVLTRIAYHLHNTVCDSAELEQTTDDALAIATTLTEPTPEGYQPGPVTFEACPDCQTLAPAWRRADYPEFVELRCACGHQSGALLDAACTRCSGSGYAVPDPFGAAVSTVCPDCMGSGYHPL